MPRRKGQLRTDWPTPEQIAGMDTSPGHKQLLRLRLTQEAAARLLGVTEIHLGNIVRGKAKPSRDLARKIKELLGFDPTECKAWKEDRDAQAEK